MKTNQYVILSLLIPIYAINSSTVMTVKDGSPFAALYLFIILYAVRLEQKQSSCTTFAVSLSFAFIFILF